MLHVIRRWEMQVKTTMRCHRRAARMAPIETGNDECRPGCGGIGTLAHGWRECKTVQLPGEAVLGFLQTLNIRLPYDPATPLPEIRPKEWTMCIQTSTCPSGFTAALWPEDENDPHVCQQMNG
uniref:Uncharacterized protein n=1 Tax=Rousettus aegyptiacus TaxID=9407 RepID=A0A7J8GBD3_ROUAE|nr:hypothetical protein HJG63_011766 [Rousettus aegyptiacus]